MNANKYYFWMRLSFLLTALTLTPVLSSRAAEYDHSSTDRYGNTMEQPNTSTSDVQLKKEIKRSLERGKDVSALAKNIDVKVGNGRVTLRGSVKTMEEKRSVEQIAKRVAGPNNVNSELEVKQ